MHKPALQGEADAVDRWTVIAIAIVAYCITNVVHEGLGHGLACVAAGGKPGALNAIYFSCANELSAGGHRVLAAGGSVANLILASLCYLGMRLRRNAPGSVHYFLWLMFALNVLMPFGYLFFSGISGFGDWGVVVDGLPYYWLFRALVALTGAALYFLVAPRILLPGLNVYLGGDRDVRSTRAKELALTPYLAGGTTFVIAGVLNPVSVWLVLLSAVAASFGGTCWLAYYPGGKDDLRADHSALEAPAGVRRSVPWMIAGAAVGLVFIGILGRGITL